MIESAATLASFILAGLAIFQLLLAAGAPIGNYAWGGAHRVLPLAFRLASLVSVFLYCCFSFVILSKADIISSSLPSSVIGISMWVLTAYFTLGILMNAASRSKNEKRVMTPIVSILALLFLYVAII